jgi:hypothetical protein
MLKYFVEQKHILLFKAKRLSFANQSNVFFFFICFGSLEFLHHLAFFSSCSSSPVGKSMRLRTKEMTSQWRRHFVRGIYSAHFFLNKGVMNQIDPNMSPGREKRACNGYSLPPINFYKAFVFSAKNNYYFYQKLGFNHLWGEFNWFVMDNAIFTGQ